MALFSSCRQGLNKIMDLVDMGVVRLHERRDDPDGTTGRDDPPGHRDGACSP